MTVEAKICGLNTPDSVTAAIDGGASYVGFVFYPPSPRSLGIEQAAKLARPVPGEIVRVGLFVDMDDAGMDAILSEVPLDLLQLHGAETPERVAEIRARTGLNVMKAVRIAGADDVAQADRYAPVCDRILFDAKPPAAMAGALPGGNALAFDWRLIAGHGWTVPWMLSGGLDAENVADAVRTSGAAAVDVSSGVEARPGVKDPARIRAFLAAVRAL